MKRVGVASLVIALAGACAHSPDAAAPVGPPSLAVAPGLPATAQAKFYADCIAASAAARDYDLESDGKTLRFKCSGSAAKAFYEGLGPWSARIGSELTGDGRIWRFTVKLQKNPDGIDHCSTDGAGDYRCVIVLNTGDFVSKADVR
jgi:hypothetical protein